MQVHSITAAFPEQIAGEVGSAFKTMPPTQWAPAPSFEVVTTLGSVSIPARIYNDVPPADASLSEVQRLVVSCLYTRHHDGRVREQYLRSIVGSAEPWVVPFVVQLVGEYVAEIVEVIHQHLVEQPADSELRAAWGEFLALNAPYWALTEAHMVSYWVSYYRWRWPALKNYPGYQVARWARLAAQDAGAKLLPARLPRARSRLVRGW